MFATAAYRWITAAHIHRMRLNEFEHVIAAISIELDCLEQRTASAIMIQKFYRTYIKNRGIASHGHAMVDFSIALDCLERYVDADAVTIQKFYRTYIKNRGIASYGYQPANDCDDYDAQYECYDINMHPYPSNDCLDYYDF
jgi:hypothetical protein